MQEEIAQYFQQSQPNLNIALPIQHFFAPGRVNLIGEHIDYNGGLVLPIAIHLGIDAWVRPRTDSVIRVHSFQQADTFTFLLSQPNFEQRKIHWHNYLLGVIKILTEQGISLAQIGIDILLKSNLPIGAGLSSSAALEVLFMEILLKYATKTNNINGIQIAELCQTVENEFVGVGCGIMDQFAVAMGKKNKAILLNCNTLDYEYIDFELIPTYQLLILNTNKSRALSESKYNERKASCDQALAIIQQHKQIDYLCQATLADLDYLQDACLKKCARHAITENLRVQEATKQLSKQDFNKFGKLLSASHQSLKQDYEVTGFELDTLVHIAQQQKGCLGARMTGAGFGGCAIALVKQNAVTDFKRTVKKQYDEQTSYSLNIYESGAYDGVWIASHH